LDFYGDFDGVRQAFYDFVSNIPFYGFAALCIDHAEVQALIPRVSDRRVVTYGMSPQADIRAIGIEAEADGARFDVSITDRITGEPRLLKGLRLPMHGHHNVQNALAAVAVGHEMGIEDETLRAALAGFAGVKRRFTKTGEVGGITVIDDYGHHPVEIQAVLSAARTATRRNVIAVVQPHRFTRLRDLFDDFCTCFNDADTVVVAPVYPAGETPIAGIDRDALIQGLRSRGHRHVLAIDGRDDLAALTREIARDGDYVICLGAGDITAWANALPDEIAQDAGSPAEAGGKG
ncbi:MAG: UDP-N-acetylmuramate--L-alanine ligase, partial [Rhodospirillaceae bacterium]|nr:UDP-N-acetylmuramate--L-alanine ligase [Rhodospirillaceae bacterium]